MTRYVRRNPDRDSIAKWKAAIKAGKRRQRQSLGRRAEPGTAWPPGTGGAYQPGMNRRRDDYEP